MADKIHFLFVCSAGINRSPAAAQLFEKSGSYEAKYAGIHGATLRDGSRTNELTQELVDWADKIFVMDEKTEGQLTYINEHFSVEGKHIAVLDIPDKFTTSTVQKYEELQSILRDKLHEYLTLQEERPF